MNLFSSPELERRADQARVALALAFLILCGAFFRLQILQHDDYAKVSENHRFRRVPMPAARGEILDRNGLPIASNIPGYSVSLLTQDVSRPKPLPGARPIPLDSVVRDSLRAVLYRMKDLVPAESIDVETVIRSYTQAPFRPVVVLASGSDSSVAVLEEHRAVLPGLLIENEPRREYPAGPAAAHLTGYLGELSREEYQKGAFPAAEPGEQVGKDGLEAEYDSILRGRRGLRMIEVTARGFLIRNRSGMGVIPPEAGTSIQTTIDLPLQIFIDSLWRADLPGKAGAMIAMTPEGEVLAYLSFPSFDPNAFIARSNPAAVRDAITNPGQPMFNRAIAGRYPPASPWKLVLAVMALRRGVAGLNTRMAVPCTGGYRFGNRIFGCWKPEGHGSLTLAEAIATSCDVYFYQLGQLLGRDALFEDGVAMGFKARSGLDLEREAPSDLPVLQDYLKSRGGWSNGEILNLSIGQGRNRQSLINMTAFYAALAGDGVKRAPFIFRPRIGAPQYDLKLTQEQLQGIRHALSTVVSTGTAAASGGRDLHVAGKTGTGQMPGRQKDMAWFIGFAPWENPQVVIGIAVEEGLHGSWVAPQVVKAIARYLGVGNATVTIPVTEAIPDSGETGDSITQAGERSGGIR